MRLGLRGILFDLDGVLYNAGEVIAGAAESLTWTRRRQIPHLFVTNTTSRPRLRQARNYGNDGSYDCPVRGMNARMTEMQAALALAGLPYVEAGIERRRRLAGVYQSRLAGMAGELGLATQRPAPAVRSTWNGFPLVAGLDAAASREAIEKSLAAEGVETRRYYDPPLHRQKLYRRFHQPGREPLALTDSISSRVVSLPLYAGLAFDDAERIARIVSTLELAGPKAPARHLPERPRGIPKSVCAS